MQEYFFKAIREAVCAMDFVGDGKGDALPSFEKYGIIPT